MDHSARRFVCAFVLSTLAARPAAAQLGEEIPSAPYFVAVQAFYSGDYRDAERVLRRETQRGVRAGQTRWIDAICYHAMLGEVLYHQGRNEESLANFDQACQVLLAYPNWLLQVKFQQPPRPDTNRARRVLPWGPSQRRFELGQFPMTEQVLIGELNATERALSQGGGVVRQAMYWRVNVIEVIRMSALAIRRRGELLGPLAKHDPITKELSDQLARGNLSPANHWSGAWIDLLRGLTQAGIGKLDEADMLLERSLVVEGRYDHPLTCVAFLEQGRIAMIRGDNRRAAQLFAEAGFSAFYYENWDVLTESVLLGWINHIASGGAGIYPPLEPVAAWAQVNRLQHITTKLRLAQAESLLWLGQLDAAAAILEDASRRLGEMRTGLPGVQLLYVQAASHILNGKVKPGSELLMQALAAQAGVSLRNFQIARTNGMYDSRVVSPRVAVDLYASLLADPTPADWVLQPLNTMAVLHTVHDASFDRWFIAALERKEPPLALEIAEQAKRRRFLASRPLGGRIAALRSILEAPEAELSRDAVLQRQQILTAFPAYRTLADRGQQIYDELRAGPLIAADGAETKKLASLYEYWEKNANQRQLLLAQFAVRRMPTSLEFPPLRTAKQLQQSLGKGEALLIFHSLAGGLYGFLVTNTNAVLWQPQDPRHLRAAIGELLQALGNYGPNRQLAVAELRSDKWRDAAARTFAAVFADSRLDLAKTTSLIIVPDDVLWYLPFEALVPDPAKPEIVLADRVLVRYGPTASLAVSSPLPLRRPQRTGIVATQQGNDETATPSEEMLQELEQVVSGPVRLPTPLPEPARVISPLMDELIGFDDVQLDSNTSSGWSALPKSRGTTDGELNAWFGLPYGGPGRVVLSGFTTAAEQGLKGSRRGGVRSARPGDELFQSLCGMMADGARTILLTRWRTSGRTNFELIREFARELPNVPANEAWQRACLLARETPLDASREPRLKRSDETGELPTAAHPFFWAGYMLVDTSPSQEEPTENVEAEADRADAAMDGETMTNKLLLPPVTRPQPAVEQPVKNGKAQPADEEATKAPTDDKALPPPENQ
ncbi:MAG: CHAT domain-containing protein [Planctomycetes bacterium]|nr:CHAT domain-containing protein [Planctomycetota bacterium]